MPENMTSEPHNSRLPGGESMGSNQTNGLNNDQQQNINDVINAESYDGSMQQILADNTGRQIVVDFLVGSTNIVRKEGILYMVGLSYIVLYDPRADTYTVCNLYSIEFVTFLPVSSNLNQAARTTLKRV